MDRKYVILNLDEIDSIDFNQVMETEASKVRKSVDGSKFFVKFEGDTPSFLEGKTIYSHSEILAILATEEWSPPDPV
tara:strand:+ start:387 stop:617 length:231 start_codon:yes stop_codon:yes gene_type:complete